MVQDSNVEEAVIARGVPAGSKRYEAVAFPVRVKAIKLHRHGDVLEFSQRQLSAHTLASFLVAQGAQDVDQLVVGKHMPYPILGFLISRRELASWIKKEYLRQLRIDTDVMVLTKAGWDECKCRVVVDNFIFQSIMFLPTRFQRVVSLLWLDGWWRLGRPHSTSGLLK